jgi:hypothetical protein
MSTRHSILDLAIQFQAASGYATLTAEQSWSPSDHLSAVQVAQHEAACALFALAHTMEKQEKLDAIRAESDAAIRAAIKWRNIK